MRSKKNMDCFKWYKGDRICYLCPYEEECKYKFALYNYADYLYNSCRDKEIFSDSYFRKCENEKCEKEYCMTSKPKRNVIFECMPDKIKKWKRKYKLGKLNNV